MKARKIQSRAARAPMFSRSRIGSAVAMALIASSGAQAAETIVGPGPAFNGAATGGLTAAVPQSNAGAVNAQVTNATVGTTSSGTAMNPAPATQVTGGNLIGASATGNIATNKIGSPGPVIPLNDSAALGVSNNTGTITSKVQSSATRVQSSTFQTGSVVNADNTISADTTLNSGTTLVTGTATTGPVFSGTAALIYPVGGPALFDATGNVVVTSMQVASGGSSSATVQDNTFALALTSNSNSTVTNAASASLERNTASAVFKGNTADNAALIQSGGAPTFAGSAVVSNLQANGNGIVAAAHSALNQNSVVTASVQGVGAGVIDALQGTLTVKGNTISSAATGNEAASATAGAAGNRILVGGVAVAGTGTAATAANDITHAGVGVVSNVKSDLAIVNSQGNLGGGANSMVTALTTGAKVYAGAQSLTGGTINLQDNSITAAVSGNTASSAIASGTGAASFTGTAAESNQQANNQIFLQGKVNPSLIEAQAGIGAGGKAAGVVAVSGNRSAATAQGNQASQSLAIDASTVAVGNTAATLTGGTSSDGRVSASGAVTLANLQGNYGSTVSAYNGAPIGTPGSQIQIVAAIGAAPIAKSDLSLTSNTQESVAVGNGAGNSLALAGASVGTGAGIASVQMGDANSFVGAALSEAQAGILVTGNLVAQGRALLEDNVQRSVAYGNAASNTLSVKANDVSVTPSGATASKVTYDAGNARPFDNALATQPVVNAAYGVLSDQSVLANVSGTTTGADSFKVSVSGNVAGTVGNDRNAYVGAAYGNDAANGVKLDVNNLGSAGFASVANVTNTQAVGGANTRIEATAAGGTAVRTVIGGTLNNATVTANDNTAQTVAYGSRATGNTVTVKGTNINTAGATVAGANLSAAGELTTNASFSVQNAQSGQGTVLAERGGSEVRTQLGGFTLLNSSVQANDNTGSASATSNSAVNGVGINASNVATTSAVQNTQVTGADVTSRVGVGAQGGAVVAVNALLVSGANISVDGNSVQSAAAGNDAVNSIDVKGTTIASGSNLPFALTSAGPTAAGVAADHALSNIQSASGARTISARAESSFGIDTQPIAVINASRFSVSDNEQSARATGNTAANSLALAATSVTARAALQSTQASDAAVRARSEMLAFAPASAVNGSTTISGNSNTAQALINDASNTVSVKGDNAAGIPGSAGLSQGVLPGTTLALGDQLLVNRQTAAALASSNAVTTIRNDDNTLPTLGLIGTSFDASGNKTYSEATANRASNASTLASSSQQTSKTGVLNNQDSTAAVTATATGTVQLALSGLALTASQATLEGNILSGAATGNSAVNSLEVKGNTVGASLTNAPAIAGTSPLGGTTTTADHALQNVQVLAAGGTVSSTVYGTAGIDTTPGAVIGTATLSVSDNIQGAKAVGNTALNSVSLSGTNVAARSALQSVQTGGAAVTASSTSTLFAPVGSTASGVRLSGNSNTSLGVINDVTNTLSVNATNTGAAGATGAVALAGTGVPGTVGAVGDLVLSNRQAASTSVSSTATTTLRNDDNTPGARALLNGSLEIAGNTTVAEASANRAVNTATVAGAAVQGANVGILNSQGNSAATTATANTVATVTLAAATPLNAGSISLDGNTTAALARGNSATNTLDSAAGSGYGAATTVGTVSQVASPLALNVGASAAILNSQANSGAVTASSTGTSYQVALNSTTAVGVSGASVGVTGNTLAAQASGNSATNRLTQTALNGAAPSAAIGNYQVNTGAVTATVTNVNFGVGVTGSVANSALRATGNQITASATGNSVVSTIAGR